MTPNFLMVLAAAAIPFLVALVWFHKSLFGGDNWHAIAEMSAEKTSPVSPLKLFLSILLNVFLAFGVFLLTVHEVGVVGMLGGDTELMKTGTAAAFLSEYGGHYHTIKHGFAHGILITLVVALPIIGYVVIFEKKSARYFWVYLGYWYVCLTLMSIVLSKWGAVAV